MTEEISGRRPIAVVTGATSGIGLEFARRLVGLGYNLIISARDGDRLAALALELEAAHSARVHVHVADLSVESDIRSLEHRMRHTLGLRMLVNNAGFISRGYLAETDVEQQAAMVRLHDIAPLRLCHAALEAMDRLPEVPGKAYKAAIVNVSSVAAFGTSEENITYCATKAFLTSFTQGLAVELRGTDVAVQALCPGYTRTELHQRARIDRGLDRGGWWLTPERVVEESLEGLRRREVVVVPGGRYKVAVAISRILSGGTQSRLKQIGGSLFGRGENVE